MTSCLGAGDSDILVAGRTVHDDSVSALAAILAEWTSSNAYAARVNNLRFGGGANGAIQLSDSTIADDRHVDTLFGNGSLDWFLFGRSDKFKDLTASELTN